MSTGTSKAKALALTDSTPPPHKRQMEGVLKDSNFGGTEAKSLGHANIQLLLAKHPKAVKGQFCSVPCIFSHS